VLAAAIGWSRVYVGVHWPLGRRGRRFFRAIPLRIAASHSEEQVSTLGVRLFVMATIGRPQCTHVMAFPMSKPFR
jgi:hypothetical protein